MARNDSPRILITRLSAIGDCVLTMPVLCALRARWPGAMLAWIAEPAAATLLEHHPCLDRLIVVPKGWLKSPAWIRRVRSELRALKLDTVVDPQSLTKSAAAGWLSGAPSRIGFAKPQGRELAPWLNTQTVRRTESHVVDAYLQLLEPLGIASPTVQFQVPIDREADATATRFVRSAHLTGGFAVINPGAGWDSRLWQADRYGLVARYLGEKYNLPSAVVWAGARERPWGEQIVASSAGHALLAPKTTLRELASLLRQARLFVGSDTGPMHLAVAVGTRCVSLHGPTNPSDSGPYGPGHVTVQASFPEPGLNPVRRRTDNHAMLAITVDAVCQACDMLLGRLVSRAVS